MKESEVYTRLGMSGKNEFESIVGFETKYHEEGSYFEILRGKTVIPRLPKSKSQGWHVTLDGETSHNDTPDLNLTLDLPEGNPQKVNGQNFFHRGHILAKEFYNFIPNEAEAKRKIKDNAKNGFIQFSESNMQQTKKNIFSRQSQAYYENRIAEYLRATKNKISYQVRVYFYDKNDQIPVGTRVSFKTKDMSLEAELCNDVFVPNFDKDFDLSKSTGYAGQESYREFYANGYDEEYRNCFSNIVRVENSALVSRTFDENHNQIFYYVQENLTGSSGLFLTCDDAYWVYHTNPEDVLIENFTKEEFFSKYLPRKYYYPARNETSNISAIFFDWPTVEALPGFAMPGKKQYTIEKATEILNWIE
ncbi:DNA/RNA non-specific endonuclease [Streptococcus panodentis]|uniref:DNA/RNA non-specific endonuclease n=1 Tax=Streptococcus panodentis TaxID=1581472 RepID=A0ABS5AWM5_9STRE|nr:DNA/RNA non-specific endonuclease [Streptococcus panodentis]MBP2620972.1 hypothetical protein [Streptococcus panodentis]